MMALRDGRWRILLVLPLLAVAIALVVWHGPKWDNVADAFRLVRWEWVAAAIALNLVSVLSRAYAWQTAIRQLLPLAGGAALAGHGETRRRAGSPCCCTTAWSSCPKNR